MMTTNINKEDVDILKIKIELQVEASTKAGMMLHEAFISQEKVKVDGVDAEGIVVDANSWTQAGKVITQFIVFV